MSFTLMRYKNGTPAPITLSIWDAFKGTPLPRPAKPQPVSTCTNVQYAIPLIPVLSAIQSQEVMDATEVPMPTAPATEPSKAASLNQPEDPSECACCHKVHDAKPADKNDAKDNKQNNSHSTNEQETYSKADNKKIRAMKSEDKTWDEILTAIGKKSKSQIKEHWKTINPNKGEKDDQKDDDENDKPTNPHSTNPEETYTKAENKKIIAMKKEDPGVSWAKVLEAIGKKSKSQIKEHWKTIDPNNKDKPKDKDDTSESKDNKSKDKKNDSDGKKDNSQKNDKSEAGELKSWSDRYDKQKWIAAASRHFDLTGQRITPAIAKRLAEGK